MKNIKHIKIYKMSSIITFIRKIFSENTETSTKPVSTILTKDNFVVVNPSDEEILVISRAYYNTEISSALHPLNINNCGSNVGAYVMSMTY